MAALALLVATLGIAASADARRLALVVGNDSYRNVAALKNARSDAKSVAAALKGLGFDVTLKEDLTLASLKGALREFKSRVSGGDEVIFYFSGHGVQFEGTNYLVPIDIVAENEQQVADDAVPLQRVLDDLRDQKARFSLAIVDACRDNPFKGAGRAIGGRGLAPVTAANGQMVLYSAGAGQSALDRLGPNDTDPNGVFTRVLLKEIQKPGVPVDRMLKVVRDEVVNLAKSASHEQVPALYDQSIGEFYFRPDGAGAAELPARAAESAPPPKATAIHVQSAVELEQAFWDRIKDSMDPADFTDYRTQFPKGVHAGEASLMARKLTRAASTHAPDPPPTAAATDTQFNAPTASTLAASDGASEPHPGYITSTLLPGSNLSGNFFLARDGKFEYRGDNGTHLRGILNLANPANITGTGMTTLGKRLGIIQTKYPDGTTGTTVKIRGRVVDGILHGEYADKFETGQFTFSIGPAN